jgi:polysaccharide pyruvyl transferase WcaK-like protein
VRFFARLDLSRQPVIFCRGDDCLNAVKKLLPEANAISFPDVAVTLPYNKYWGAEYLGKLSATPRQLVTLSPSAVMYSRYPEVAGENQHVRQAIDICKQLISMGYRVLLVPHTLRPAQPSPKVCDLAVAKIIFELVDDPNVLLIDDDLSPAELKAIIANADFHIGARYHSIVAALSSGVPAISISWHPKYRDLMRSYGMEDYVLEERDVSRLATMLRQIVTDKDKLSHQLDLHQGGVAQKVKVNARLFHDLLKGSKT